MIDVVAAVNSDETAMPASTSRPILPPVAPVSAIAKTIPAASSPKTTRPAGISAIEAGKRAA